MKERPPALSPTVDRSLGTVQSRHDEPDDGRLQRVLEVAEQAQR
jgi:hypothetical protein